MTKLLGEQLGGGRTPSPARRKVLVRGGKCSCESLLLGDGHESTHEAPFLYEAETPRQASRKGFCRARRKLLGVASRWNYSCEAETTRARRKLLGGASPRNSFESLLVRGEEYRCERVYTEKLLRNGKKTATSEIPTQGHRLSDLKTRFSYLYPSFLV
jgi:hypothetical protein